ncbi:PHD and RING finger domain-containing 1 isoform X4, partial [Paramuricea clavata]
NINTCPVDRKVFYTIAVKKAENGVTIEEIKVEDKTQVKEEYEDPTSCEICGIGDREDRMLLCDGCDRGFHLECLSPPLDSVPDEEWFCRDCFIDTAQDNTQEHDTIDYSQHAIAFSDDEIPTFESESRPIASSIISSRASTSQRRARTVATSRQRRRRRRTTQGSSRTPARRPKRKKTTKKTKSSHKGASTMTTPTSKPKRRKRKRRRKSAKKKKRKIKSDEDVHQSTTRYLLPREMEPTATFSLFGSDFDLEYLPVIESPASAITSQQSSPP